MNRSTQLSRTAVAWLVLVVWACWTPLLGDDGTAEMEKVWGQDLRRVRSTPNAADDVALAGELIKAAKLIKEKPDQLTALCETAYELAMKYPTGYTAAVDAMELLAGAVPDKALACGEKILAVRQKQYYASKGPDRAKAGEDLLGEALHVAEGKLNAGQYADAAKLVRQVMGIATALQSPLRQDLQEILKRAMHLEKVQQQVQQCEALLKTDSSNQAARDKLVSLNLIELDRPDEAAKFLAPDSDERMRTYIPLIAKDTEDLPEGVCAEIGDWYRTLTSKASAVAKPAMLRRACRYYELFLQKHTADDLTRTKVALALKKVEAELAKLEQGEPGSWQDILAMVNVAKHTSGGPWARKGSLVGMPKPSVDLPVKFGTVMFPVLPKGGYEMQIAFTRADGTGPIAVYVPIGSTRITVAMGMDEGAYSALDKIGGEPKESNKITTKPGKISIGQDVLLHVKVVVNDKTKEGEIDVKMDGNKYLYWKGALADLSRPDREPKIGDGGAPGMGTLNSRFVVSGARLRMLSGKMETATGTTGGPIRDPGAGSNDPGRAWRNAWNNWGRGGRGGGRR